ncbi:uncharacterized protein LOC121738157 [Aricia agestis]|uniref:uncharacterized protein LOC121738157 n=1 Tax=Aricia agestis TaxID=91739 RepID=UPI001C209D67|nr:uncharacterized protein LOC121738157 [Aricia agestis]
MKLLLLFVSCVALAAAYQDLDDNYYGKILSEKAALENFYKCLIDQAPCNDFGNHVKTHMVEFFGDGCEECDDQQKHFSHLLLMIVKNDYPDMLKAIEDKYDLNSNANNVDEKLKKF